MAERAITTHAVQAGGTVFLQGVQHLYVYAVQAGLFKLSYLQDDGTVKLTQTDCGEDYIITAHPEQIVFIARRVCGMSITTAEQVEDLERKLSVITDRLERLAPRQRRPPRPLGAERDRPRAGRPGRPGRDRPHRALPRPVPGVHGALRPARRTPPLWGMSAST